jgi:hypothetical protein
VVFSAKTLSLLVIVALGLDAVLLLLLATTAGTRRKPSQGLVHMDDVLRGVLEGHAKTLQRLDGAIRKLSADDQRLAERLSGAVQRVGLVRYDAFEEMGGRLSFSCALLDDRGTGVVVTSINGRQDTRVYAKPVNEGRSDHNLSEEEVVAIAEALTGSREAVKAR